LSDQITSSQTGKITTHPKTLFVPHLSIIL
jgi:hypothetical protein